jgi:glycosyltransferase involved in cell wall biosynthesis
MPVSIGVAARNEEATVAAALRSIEAAVAALPEPGGVEVIVALNGCTDATADVVVGHVAAYRGDIEYHIMKTPTGLVEAQRAIAAAAAARDFVVFVDADCVLDPGCLGELVAAMTQHPQVRAAWASMVPAGGRRGFWRGVYNFADYHPEVVHRGRHLCGRAFAIRGYDVPLVSPAGAAPVPPRVAAYLGLDRGPVGDDSFLSRALIARHGVECIQHAAGARVYFQPIPRLSGFWAAQRRKQIEPRRLDLLFPEYTGVRRRHFGRRVDRAAYRRLRPIERLQCRVYLALYSGLRRLAALQLSAAELLVRAGVPLRPVEVWPVVAGTKERLTAGG